MPLSASGSGDDAPAKIPHPACLLEWRRQRSKRCARRRTTNASGLGRGSATATAARLVAGRGLSAKARRQWLRG
eukprot:9091890-Alexandrium_andersonii.AAC.1